MFVSVSEFFYKKNSEIIWFFAPYICKELSEKRQ